MSHAPARCTRRPHWKTLRPPPLEGIPASVLHLPARGSPALLLDHLVAQFAHVARATWMEHMRAGRVLDAHARPLAPDAATPAGKWIWYYRVPQSEPRVPFAETVVFQDEWLVVADKPHFLPVAPAGRYARETLLARLQRRLQLPHLAPLHRLDRETAGLVIFAVQPHTRNAYAQLFRERSVHKEYVAIARENPVLDLRGPLLHTSYLKPHPQDFFRTTECHDVPPNSSTLIERIERLPGQRVLLRLLPRTGQRHQLRVHLNAVGMPIAGDRLYPRVLRPAAAMEDYRHPLQLLARHLAFTDPITGETRTFTSRRTLDLEPGQDFPARCTQSQNRVTLGREASQCLWWL